MINGSSHSLFVKYLDRYLSRVFRSQYKRVKKWGGDVGTKTVSEEDPIQRKGHKN